MHAIPCIVVPQLNHSCGFSSPQPSHQATNQDGYFHLLQAVQIKFRTIKQTKQNRRAKEQGWGSGLYFRATIFWVPFAMAIVMAVFFCYRLYTIYEQKNTKEKKESEVTMDSHFHNTIFWVTTATATFMVIFFCYKLYKVNYGELNLKKIIKQMTKD